jgi:hypothetical protein
MVETVMRSLTFTFLLVACGLVQAAAQDSAPATERLTGDTPKTTVLGNSFVAPAGWSVSVRGPATIVEAPEGDSRIVLVDVKAKDADAALAAGWKAYKENQWRLKIATDQPDKDGWSRVRNYSYQTSPNEKRGVGAGVRFAGDVWTVWIYDMAHAVGDKRGAQVALIFDKLLPKGYTRESFAGRKPNTLDAARNSSRTDKRSLGCRAFRSAWCRTARSFSQMGSACASSARRRSRMATRPTWSRRTPRD